MLEGEQVLEVEDGEEEADELPEGDYKCHDEGGALGCQGEHSSDADVSRGWSQGFECSA